MNHISELIDDIRNGKMVILVDDEDRENEGDLILAADFVTPDAINFMVTEGRGLVCLAMSTEQVDRLSLPLMVGDSKNYSPNKTAFTVSIEAAKGISTGISAADRAHTIRIASNPTAEPEDVIMPGHVFPIKAQPGGVLKRAGHTEASVDLSVLAGLAPAAVICEIMKTDGSMARVGDLGDFAKKHNIKIGTIEELIKYRIEHETLIEKTTHVDLPVNMAPDAQYYSYKSLMDGSVAEVLVQGKIDPARPVLVRIQTENSFDDLMQPSMSGKPSLAQMSLQKVCAEESGIFLYIKKNTSNLPSFLKTKQASKKMDPRDYGFGAQVLRDLGVKKMRLLANRPSKRVGLKGFGIEIVDSVSLQPDSQEPEDKYSDFFLSQMSSR